MPTDRRFSAAVELFAPLATDTEFAEFYWDKTGRRYDRLRSTNFLHFRCPLMSRIDEILSWYESDRPGVLKNLRWIMENGNLADTGKFVILPVDQGFEHGSGAFVRAQELRIPNFRSWPRVRPSFTTGPECHAAPHGIPMTHQEAAQ